MASVIPSAPLGTDAAADRAGLGAAGVPAARAGSGSGEEAAPGGSAAERRFRFELAAHPGSPAQARRLTRARLTGWSVCADTCDTAALVISELVTNAIVHTASSRVVCELHDHDDMLRIAVHDEGCAPGEPHPSPQRPEEEHGRGLLLVDALCRSWGAQEHGPGLLVWAELARRTDAARDTAEPRDDLGWGARPKPGGPPPGPGEEDEAEARHGAAPAPPHGPVPAQQHRPLPAPQHGPAPARRRAWERP
ncbi:ATP-binding protein [Streptomyces bungoensis]|nr:ATP-binding protein [Streptomyces bungoensis]